VKREPIFTESLPSPPTAPALSAIRSESPRTRAHRDHPVDDCVRGGGSDLVCPVNRASIGVLFTRGILNRDLDDLLDDLRSDEHPRVAEAARAAGAAHHDLCQSLDDLARALLDSDLLDAAEAVCRRLAWTVERSELQARIAERWCRVGQAERALACFDAAEASARSESTIEMRAGALADLAVHLAKANERERASRVRKRAIADAEAGQLLGHQTGVDSSKVLAQIVADVARECATEEAKTIALRITIHSIRERALSSCEPRLRCSE